MEVWLTYTDSDWREIGSTKNFDLDLAFGNDENDFDLVVPSGIKIEYGCLVYIDGTEFGGIVRKSTFQSNGKESLFSAGGETWHGIMASRALRPVAGSDYYTVSGEANTVLAEMASAVGLLDVFSISMEDSGIAVNEQFERFADFYSCVRKMLARSDAKLKIAKQPGSKPELSAVRRGHYVDDADSDRFTYKVSDGVSYNHVLGLGKGALSDRITVDLYADRDGSISRTQTIFGRDYRQYLYEVSNAEEEELVSDCTKKLKELQATTACELFLPDSESYDVGDIVGIEPSESDISIVSDVTKVIVKAYGSGIEISNEIGEVTASSGGGVSNESAGAGGLSYRAGDGIRIKSGTISADVTSDMLNAVVSTAEDAALNASNASAAAAEAQETARSRVASVKGTEPISATPGTAIILSHDESGVAAGAYGPVANADTPSWGDSVNVGPRITVDAKGHIRSASGRTFSIPSAAASASKAGLLSAADKQRIDTYPWSDIGNKPPSYPPSVHTHLYASSISAGGAATSANKLAVSRKIKLSGAAIGEASFDGSADIEIVLSGDSAAAPFLSVWRVGTYLPSDGTFDPNSIGGTWVEAPSLGPHWWLRKK